MRPDAVVGREPSVAMRVIASETVFLADKDGHVAVLRGDAARIWLSLDPPASGAEVAMRVARAKRVGTDRIVPKVYRVLDHLSAIGLVTIKEPQRAGDSIHISRQIAKGQGQAWAGAQRQDALNDICFLYGVPIRVQLNLTYGYSPR